MKFRELFVEDKNGMVFDIYIDDVKKFSSNADNAADQIDKKLKQKKFQNGNIKIFRTDKSGTEDVTKLFEVL